MNAFCGLVASSLTLLAYGLAPSHATTIRSVGLDEMLQRAEFIFEGTVRSVEVRGGPRTRGLRTCASFDILEILKGPNLPGPLELCFAGGVKGSIRRSIHRMVYPVEGETGIYFVASIGEHYTHPLYGWNQGYLRIRKAAAETADTGVHTVDGAAVVDVETRPDPGPPGLSTGAARGILTRRPRAAGARAMTPQRFKAKLRQLLERP